MSMPPYDDEAIENDEEQLVVQRTDFAPIDKKDSPSAWRNFCNGFRNLLGFKSIELAERYAEARVRKEEFANDAIELQARGDYELKMAEAEKLRSEARKNDAEAGAINKKNLDSQVAEILRDHSIEEAEQKVLDIIKRIEIEHGGRVEIDTGESQKTDVTVAIPPLELKLGINTPGIKATSSNQELNSDEN